MDIPYKKYGFASKYRQNFYYNLLNNWATCYFEILEQTEQLLTDFSEAFPEKNARCLPVPVTEIAGWLNFDIQRKSLNTIRNANLGLVLGRLESTDGKWTIFLEEPYNLTHEQERFAIANLLGQYYVGRNAEFAECAEVRFPTDNGEIMAMIFTAFLLFPPQSFFKEADNYADIEMRPIDQELMLRTLSKRAKVPYYYTGVCYEYLKILASYARMKNFNLKIDFVKTLLQEKEEEAKANIAQCEQKKTRSRLDPSDYLAPEKFFY